MNKQKWLGRIASRTTHDGQCAIWTGVRKKSNRYAAMYIPREMREALGIVREQVEVHRVLAYLMLGPCPEGMQVRHTCGRGRYGCVTPEHMAYGTVAQNCYDTLMHGHHRGRYGAQKLDVWAAAQIRWRRTFGESAKALAKEFGVSHWHVYRVASGTRWGYTPPVAT